MIKASERAPILSRPMARRGALAGSRGTFGPLQFPRSSVQKSTAGRPNNHSGPPESPIVPFSKCADSEWNQSHPVTYSTVFLLLKLEESHGMFSVLSFVGLIVMQNRNRRASGTETEWTPDGQLVMQPMFRRAGQSLMFPPLRLYSSDRGRSPRSLNHPAAYSPFAAFAESSKILACCFQPWLHSLHVDLLALLLECSVGRVAMAH